MPRIRIDLPEKFIFSTDIPLYQLHMNYGNHLDNALLLTVVSEARVRFLKSMGYGELDVEGVGIIVADAALQYRSEGHHGEVMRVDVAVDDIGSKGCDIVWRMAEASSDREVARGKTGIVFFDYAQKKIAAIPPAFLEKIGASAA